VLTQLLATSAVTDLVGTRGYQLKLPQSPTYPAFVVMLVDEPGRNHLRGPNRQVFAWIQIDVYDEEANGYTALNALVAAINDALEGKAFSAAGLRITGVALLSKGAFNEPPEHRLNRIKLEYHVGSR
jgi:hypothetical protein